MHSRGGELQLLWLGAQAQLSGFWEELKQLSHHGAGQRAAGSGTSPGGTCSVGTTHLQRWLQTFMEFLDSVSGPGFQFWVLSTGRAQQGGEMLSLVTKGGQANCGWAGGSLPARVLEAQFRRDCACPGDGEGACEKLA